jgi:hypothetical protein
MKGPLKEDGTFVTNEVFLHSPHKVYVVPTTLSSIYLISSIIYNIKNVFYYIYAVKEYQVLTLSQEVSLPMRQLWGGLTSFHGVDNAVDGDPNSSCG